MKKLIALILALAFFLPCMTLAESVTATKNATITVTGSAAVSLKADYAQISVGVSTKAATVEEASKQNTAAIHTVIAALKEAGVKEEDIATSNYSVNAEYDYSSFGGQKLTGYNVTNQLNVIIRDMEHIGATLDKATAAGANSIYNIQFLSTKADAAQDEAASYAVQDAMRRAKLLADAAGLQLGSIVSISDSTSGFSVVTRSYKSNLAADAVSNSILPDNTSVSASVTMVFELAAVSASATPIVSGSYETFCLAENEGYFTWVRSQHAYDKVVGPVLNAEDALQQAQTLWGEAFEKYEPTEGESTIAYDPQEGVWFVKGPMPANMVGGTAKALIHAADGQVLAVWHEK